MKDKWLVTLEIDTYDGDPRQWEWSNLYIGEESVKVVETQFKGRVHEEMEGESNE
jgi:hypothetical protein